jgi:hypothetical protein
VTASGPRPGSCPFNLRRDVFAAVSNTSGVGVVGAVGFESDLRERELATLGDDVGKRR